MISTVLEYCTLQFRHQFRVFVVPDQLSAVTAVHRFKSTADSPVFVVTVQCGISGKLKAWAPPPIHVKRLHLRCAK